jgi:hypothetical protein
MPVPEETVHSTRVAKKGQICFASKTNGDGTANKARTSQFIYGRCTGATCTLQTIICHCADLLLFSSVKDEKSASECHSVIGEVVEGREWLEGASSSEGSSAVSSGGIYTGYGEQASMESVFKKELYLQQVFPKMDRIE